MFVGDVSKIAEFCVKDSLVPNSVESVVNRIVEFYSLKKDWHRTRINSIDKENDFSVFWHWH